MDQSTPRDDKVSQYPVTFLVSRPKGLGFGQAVLVCSCPECGAMIQVHISASHSVGVTPSELEAPGVPPVVPDRASDPK